ncbi:MAG: pseudouridine synthase [Breznakibacter sp.]
MGPKPYLVRQSLELLPFLLETFKGKSRTSIKAMLSHQMVTVNGRAVKQFNHQLKPGDKVFVGHRGENSVKARMPLEILFEDDYLIVIHKPSGLLTIATDDEKQETAYRMVSNYLKSCHPNSRVFILHRLDRDTSGIMMFAKSQEIQAKMQQNWDEEVVDRQYVAVVEGTLRVAEGVIDNWLEEGKTGMVHVSRVTGKGKRAITHFKRLKSNPSYSLLSLTLETGRKTR